MASSGRRSSPVAWTTFPHAGRCLQESGAWQILMACTIATWFVADDPGTSTTFPQVPGSSWSPRFQSTYWKCIVVFFGSSIRQNPEYDHVLFTNVNPPEIDGFDVHGWLMQHGVRVIKLDIRHRLGVGSVSSWGNQFYILDIIQLVANDNDIEILIVLDSDCVWMRSAKSMECAIEQEGVLTYGLWYDSEQIVNGLNRKMMDELYESFFGEPSHGTLAYCGGELFAATKHHIQQISEKIDVLWNKNSIEQESNRPFCHEEAQFLSLLYHKMGFYEGTANQYIKRIWTSPRFHNFDQDDRNLVIWHLPAEKRLGLQDIFQDVCEQSSRFWTISIEDPFINYVEQTVGLSGKPWMLRLRWLKTKLSDRVAAILN